MRASKAAIDPLWQCLCPAWSQSSTGQAARLLNRPRVFTLTPRRPNRITAAISTSARRTNQTRLDAAATHDGTNLYSSSDNAGIQRYKSGLQHSKTINFEVEDTQTLYGRLLSAAVNGRTAQCRAIAEHLVKEKREEPNLQIYNALILSNTSHEQGAAWRVADLLDEMKAEGLQPDAGTCHNALKVLAVHVDHLLRTDILDYMSKRWFQLSEDGAHDVAAGLLREGLFEQALKKLDEMSSSNMRMDAWLWNMAVYALCDAGEVEEAYRIMRTRHDAGEANLSRSLWTYLLNKGSDSRHYEATSLVWMSQVKPGYINPSSGICLNVLATAARAGDPVLGTEVFAHLSKRGTAFEPIHYELLISTYLAANPPDVKRALSILTIMPLEKLEPTAEETRSLYMYLHDKPALVKEAFDTVRELHEQNRKIPIALLNLLIECHVEQHNLPEAMNLYKLIHTFAPIALGAQKSFANIDTFNLLLKGCRIADPPDERQASFLVSELLALRVVPTQLTYDRLILVFVTAAQAALRNAAAPGQEQDAASSEREKGLQLLDWSFRHFTDMQELGWMPRLGTLVELAVELARTGDARCWDVWQRAEDQGEKIQNFAKRRVHARAGLEEAWEEYAKGAEGAGASDDGDKSSAPASAWP